MGREICEKMNFFNCFVHDENVYLFFKYRATSLTFFNLHRKRVWDLIHFYCEYFLNMESLLHGFVLAILVVLPDPGIAAHYPGIRAERLPARANIKKIF